MTALPEVILRGRVIAVARGLDADRARDLARALADGGIEVLEVTVEGPDGFAALEAVAGTGPCVGVGTVTTPEQVRLAAEAGAEFVVSPHTDAAVVEAALDLGLPALPGAFTPTEAARAARLGASAVKVFPASVGGPALVAAMLGPFPDLDLVPTGGIDADNVARFLAAGAVAVGVGGWLTAHGPAEAERRAGRLVSAVAKVV